MRKKNFHSHKRTTLLQADAHKQECNGLVFPPCSFDYLIKQKEGRFCFSTFFHSFVTKTTYKASEHKFLETVFLDTQV